jgi:hypothetical protein
MAGSLVAVPKPVLGKQMTVHIWSTYLVDGTEQLWMEGSSWYMEDCVWPVERDVCMDKTEN